MMMRGFCLLAVISSLLVQPAVAQTKTRYYVAYKLTLDAQAQAEKARLQVAPKGG